MSISGGKPPSGWAFRSSSSKTTTAADAVLFATTPDRWYTVGGAEQLDKLYAVAVWNTVIIVNDSVTVLIAAWLVRLHRSVSTLCDALMKLALIAEADR